MLFTCAPHPRTGPIVQAHSHGVYVLRTYYVRKGTSDLFHGNPGVIEVDHYRCIRFLPCSYAILAPVVPRRDTHDKGGVVFQTTPLLTHHNLVNSRMWYVWGCCVEYVSVGVHSPNNVLDLRTHCGDIQLRDLHRGSRSKHVHHGAYIMTGRRIHVEVAACIGNAVFELELGNKWGVCDAYVRKLMSAWQVRKGGLIIVHVWCTCCVAWHAIPHGFSMRVTSHQILMPEGNTMTMDSSVDKWFYFYRADSTD